MMVSFFYNLQAVFTKCLLLTLPADWLQRDNVLPSSFRIRIEVLFPHTWCIWVWEYEIYSSTGYECVDPKVGVTDYQITSHCCQEAQPENDTLEESKQGVPLTGRD